MHGGSAASCCARWPSSGQPAGCRGTGLRNTRGPYAVSCREGSGSARPSRTYIPRARDESCSINSTAFQELTRVGSASPSNVYYAVSSVRISRNLVLDISAGTASRCTTISRDDRRGQERQDANEHLKLERPTILPRRRGLELRRQAEQRRLVTEARRELHAERQAALRHRERHRHRRVAR